MKIFSISGLDGSGKSTQIQLLREYFEKNNKKVFYFHAVQFSIANILKKSQREESSGKTIDITKAPWSKVQLRKIALFTDVIRFKLLTKKLEKDYDLLLTDRYFYDMIVNISYLQKTDYRPFFLHWITLPDKRFFLNVNPQYIMMRDNPPSQGHSYLVEKNEIFHRYIDDFALTLIDGSRDKQVIFEDILSEITSEK